MKFDQKKKYYVYAWFYKQTGKLFYIGKGTKYRYRSKKRDNSTLVEIINTCDCDSKILKGNLTEEEAFECEKEMIKEYRKLGHPLINIQDGGHFPPNHAGTHKSQETREKMSKSMKKYFEEHPDQKVLASENMKKFLKTEAGKEFQKKSAESRKNDEFMKKLSVKCREANNTDEYKKRQSEIVKNMWKSAEYKDSHSGANNCNAQAVRQYDLNRNFVAEYSTITEASEKTGVNSSKISMVAKGKRKSSGGYLWEYVNDKKISRKKINLVYDVRKDKSAVPILQYDINGNFLAEYNSVAEATKINNFSNRTNISANLRGRTKSAYGYVWKYKHDNTVPSQTKTAN